MGYTLGVSTLQLGSTFNENGTPETVTPSGRGTENWAGVFKRKRQEIRGWGEREREGEEWV